MVSRPARQHYIPRFYLEQFTDKDGFVWTYEKGTGRKWGRSTKNTAVETNIYSIKNEDGTHDDKIEEILSRIESDVAPIIPKIKKGELPNNDEREKFSLFVASLFVRSPTLIRIAAEISGHTVGTLFSLITADRETFDASMRAMVKDKGEQFRPEEYDEAWEIVKDPKKYSVKVRRDAGLIAFSNLDKVAEIFYMMNFSVFTTRNQHLITSDIPLVSTPEASEIDPTKIKKFPYARGFFSKDAIITLPLSPDRMAVFYWKKQLPPKVYILNKQMGRIYNRQRAIMAEKYLFASQNDSGISKLAQKYPEPGFQIYFSNDDHVPEIKVIRKLDEK